MSEWRLFEVEVNNENEATLNGSVNDSLAFISLKTHLTYLDTMYREPFIMVLLILESF